MRPAANNRVNSTVGRFTALGNTASAASVSRGLRSALGRHQTGTQKGG